MSKKEFTQAICAHYRSLGAGPELGLRAYWAGQEKYKAYKRADAVNEDSARAIAQRLRDADEIAGRISQ